MLTHREIVDRMPLALSKRPTHKGYPVPWFTPRNPHTGDWDFRFIEQGKVQEAVRRECCWTCGERLVLPCAFVIGPMCAVNRVSSEPPSHVACAIYAAKACPFLARPKMERPSLALPAEAKGAPAGVMIERNPGVAMVWVTKRPTYMTQVKLFDVGAPERVRFFAHSRPATREEVLESITSGVPYLRASADPSGPAAMAALDREVERAMALVDEALPALA